jgi:hypothetical protein
LKLLILLGVILLVGCSEVDPNKIEHDIGMRHPLEEVCIDGVVYYSQYRQLAVGFNPDSTVKTCGV